MKSSLVALLLVALCHSTTSASYPPLRPSQPSQPSAHVVGKDLKQLGGEKGRDFTEANILGLNAEHSDAAHALVNVNANVLRGGVSAKKGTSSPVLKKASVGIVLAIGLAFAWPHLLEFYQRMPSLKALINDMISPLKAHPLGPFIFFAGFVVYSSLGLR